MQFYLIVIGPLFFSLQSLVLQQQQYISDTSTAQTSVQTILQEATLVYKQGLAAYEVCAYIFFSQIVLIPIQRPKEPREKNPGHRHSFLSVLTLFCFYSKTFNLRIRYFEKNTIM